MFTFFDRLGALKLSDQQLFRVRIFFYLGWIIINLLQAGFTRLIFDEAYYWVCSTELDWGHYHHPPFISLMIRAGYSLFPSELGVRLFFVLGTTGGIFLLEKLLLKKDLLLFYAILISIVSFQVVGILAAPDIALFFLSVTFYLLFRRFLNDNNFWITALLALNTALLLYAKYHGIILIAFSFLFNFRFLISKSRTWIWIFLSILLFTPHLWWQFSNNFPTFRFHIFERPGKGIFNLVNLIDFIPGQLLVTGPLAGFVMFWAITKLNIHQRFEKTMLFNLVAMYIFFQLIAIYHHIEANWTIIGFAPLIVLSHKAMVEQPQIRKWLFRLLPFSLLLAIVFRGLLLFPGLIKESRIYHELGGYKTFSKELLSVVGDYPVVFTERYQPTSQFAFYSGGHPTFTLNPTQMSEFDFMSMEANLQGQNVMIVSSRKWNTNMDSIITIRGVRYYTKVENFRSYKKVLLKPELITTNNQHTFRLSMENHYPYPITFLENEIMPTMVGYILYQQGKEIEKNDSVFNAVYFNQANYVDVILNTLEKGDYQIQFILKTGWFPSTRNSRLISFTVN